nr:immunoglobulin domain-containing protein [Oscillospiraceae bacterium]
MQKTKTRSFLGRLLRGSVVLAMAAIVLPKLGAVKAEAASYNLTICGTNVTDDNKSDILGDGVFSYDADAKKLYVHGNKTNNDASPIILSQIKDLTVEVSANSTLIQQADYPAIRFTDSATIQGPRSLTVKNTASNNSIAIFTWSPVEIRNISLSVETNYDAFSGSKTGKLTITKSDVNIKAHNSWFAFYYFDSITLNGCHIVSPTDCVLTDGASRNAAGGPVSELSIQRETLALAGTDVFAGNMDDIFGDGNFRYIPASNTLLIAGDLTTENAVLESDVPGLTVVVEKDCELISTADNGFVLSGDTTITGQGQMHLISERKMGIWLRNSAKLTISEITANINSADFGITGDSLQGVIDGESLLFSHCQVTVSAGSHGAVTELYGGISFNYAQAADSYAVSSDHSCIYNIHTANAGACSYCLIVPVDSNCWTLDTWIDGVQVTAANAGDILGNGVFRYNPNTYVLHVDGEYSSLVSSVIDTGELGSTIQYEDGTKLTATAPNKNALYVYDELISLRGNGTLNLISEQSSAIYVSYTTLSINPATQTGSPTIIANGAAYGIEGSHAGLDLDAAVLDVSAADDNGIAVGGFTSGITFRRCRLETPENASVQDGRVVDSEGQPANPVRTEREELYPVCVDNVQATSFNCDDILGNGLFSYSPGSHSLTVKSSYTSQGDLICLYNETDFYIHTEGDVTLRSETGNVISTEASLSLYIDSSTKLTLEAPQGVALFADGGTINIKPSTNNLSAELSATGWCGIRGCGSGNRLSISCVTVNAQSTAEAGTGGDAINGFANGITLNECSITAGGTVQNGAVVDSNGNNSMNVTVTALKKYQLWIAGTQVTEANQNDILGNGVFAYIPSDNMLTVNGDYSCGPARVIKSEIPGLRINVLSDSVLTVTGYYSVCSIYADTTIFGDGKLTMNATNQSIIDVNYSTLTFENIEVEATASGIGFYGYTYRYDAKLVLKNVRMQVSCKGDAVCNFDGGIELIDCHVTEPEGAFTDYGTIRDSSGTTLQEFTIEPCKTLTADMVTLSKTSFAYTGNPIDVAAYLTVKHGSKTLVRDTDYTVKLFDNTEIGTETVLIRIYGIDAYGGTVERRVTIYPTQPATVTAALGSTAKFTVNPAGEGYYYQWQYYNTNTKKWVNSGMTGSTTATLSVEVTAARDGQKYRCLVTDAYGAKAYSNAATLKVKPAITTQPKNTSAAVGETAKFTIAASGSGLKYQWQYYNTNTSKWVNSGLTGNTTATLSVPVTAARDGQKYRCIVTAANGATATSSTAVLKVKPAITAQPANVTAAVGATAKFTVAASGTGLKYQWQYDNGSGWKNSTQSGYNTATLSIPVTAARDGQKYRCVITGSNGASANSNAATLKVKTVITKQP